MWYRFGTGDIFESASCDGYVWCSEKVVQQALDALMADKSSAMTTIVIAHRCACKLASGWLRRTTSRMARL